MTSKKWCMTFLFSIFLILFLYGLFNVVTDPFGVFGDLFLNWYSYDMTNNPRVAKIGYLEKEDHYKNYDSYIIGCSSTSSFPVEDLNHYLGGSWYNMIVYGADMLDTEQFCQYVIEHYQAKNIMVNIFISNATKYGVEEDKITHNMPAKVAGTSHLQYYSRYLFLNTQYGFAKLKAHKQDTYLTQPFDVFQVQTGAYDKKVRDVEPIGNFNEYIAKYPIFANYPQEALEMDQIDTTVASVKRIKEMCDKNGVKVTFVMAPVYKEYLKYFKEEQVKEFYTKIAEVTDYWDFTTSCFTAEPRFFYDETHFRNAFGTMAIAKMAGATDRYYPETIGEFVTKENVSTHVERLWKQEEESYSKKVPILTYHSFVEEPKENAEISPETFEKQIQFLKENGYEGVTFEDLVAYVEKGEELPEKPVCITIDDGYWNNYALAFPILKKYQMKATIFVIGSSVGKEVYKDTNYKMTPHFSYEVAKEMIHSGLISIQSHTYDLHQWAPYEEDPSNVHKNMLPLAIESEEEYIAMIKQDCIKMEKEIQENLGTQVIALAYPSGQYSTLTNVALKEAGVKVTVCTYGASNEIIKGLPQSLYALNRYNVDETVSLEVLLSMCS